MCLKKYKGLEHPFFFPVLSTDWREGELRGANEPMMSGRWIFHAICSLLLVLRYLESLYLSVTELNIFIHWLISLERSYLLSLNLCQHWGKKIIRNSTWSKNGISHAICNTQYLVFWRTSSFELIAGIKCFRDPNANNFIDNQWIFT